ncbi:hypothetical protein DASC09_043940 [Saccharomycopsis crataegensis]|uniref:NADP-dependent oxidoreductase domain-containing protein n=1 Tax=Saccharomycopsis crataegensis TaxID=43959 RepID=A0AAV5QQS6_9ASCO|nr:hypothetical protein DASC09_043940 [Saccharomycopsis crataegensis]
MSLSMAPVKLNDGNYISRVGFGIFLVDPEETVNSVYNAIKIGYRHIHSAEYYENELESARGIKKWLDEDPVNNKRSDVFYTTKVAMTSMSYEKASINITKRLEIIKPLLGYIDLLLIHAPIADSPADRVGAYRALEQYKMSNPTIMRSIGVSNYAVRHLKELSASGINIKPAINPVELHP